ncbi:MAG: glycosyltransferase [Capsulimonas sp.]|uniref:glycosyltransferase n=1 Tax=Capsulimonas sp. TaxID=2494211 RepID=UPI003264BB03
MRLQLTPRRTATFGQDFLAERINRRLRVTPLAADTHGVFLQNAIPEDAHLIISHNPEDAGESRLLAMLPSHARAVVHRHVQWSYLSAGQQENVRRSMANAALCIAPAEFLAQESRALFPETRCEVVHIGRDPMVYRPASLKARLAFRTQLQIPEDSFLAIHIGRLEDAKGLQILTTLAARLPERAVLLMQFTANSSDVNRSDGFWPQARAIQSANPTQVRLWPDTDPASDRPVRYADLLISTSLKEVAPMVAVEALMSGVPVAATDSTPFYGEIHTLGVADEDLAVIPLPFSERLTTLTRDQLTLTEHEVTITANLMAGEIEGQIARGVEEMESALRAQRIMDAGFTEDAMVARLDALYRAVITE